MEATKPYVHIYIESNPNPNSLKFVVNQMLFPEGESYDFPDLAAAEHAPLAKELLQHDFVDRVFYMNNFITVTKKDTHEWGEIKFQIRDLIRDFIEAGRDLLDGQQPEDEAVNDDPKVQQIKMILDEYIKPAVEQDGGAITFKSFNGGLLTVTLQGACSGCPSSTVTLKAGIENLMKRMVPEVQTVEAESV
jgi:Fe-S cluster biogenesis protein NfuA